MSYGAVEVAGAEGLTVGKSKQPGYGLRSKHNGRKDDVEFFEAVFSTGEERAAIPTDILD